MFRIKRLVFWVADPQPYDLSLFGASSFLGNYSFLRKLNNTCHYKYKDCY